MGLFSFGSSHYEALQNLTDEIEKKYEELSIDFDINQKLYSAFNERFYSAQQSRLNLELFLREELKTVDEIIAKRDRAIESEKQLNKRVNEFKNKDVFNKIQTENNNKIEDYPSKNYIDGMDFELDKLFGAFSIIYDNIFPKIDKICRSRYNRVLNESLTQVELSIYPFIQTRGVGTIPDILEKYSRALKMNNSSSQESEKTAILKVAINVLSGIKKYIANQSHDNASLSPMDAMTLKMCNQQIDEIINNFRLSAFITNK